ncbi:hypothetical protein J3U99_20815 [Brucella pituitosa]|uniref:DUF6953 family protein n=1 Tax=Brucella pituitosa TaxID=571256 RepID=UPI0020048108|nr:hypothetical protein [Brucella pituitosa]MCK4207213.1 hypothetical protein [Brucella pituitosa]
MAEADIDKQDGEHSVFEKAAKWMHEALQEKGYLDQGVAVASIRRLFGQDVTYQNENGNLAISKKVLKLFKKLTEDDFVWDKSDRAWKKRTARHKPGRQQD